MKTVAIIGIIERIILILIFLLVVFMLITNKWSLLWKYAVGAFIFMIILEILKGLIQQIIQVKNGEYQFEPTKERD